jgi:5-methyltetrahydropteroyltriglutamate--homocysteine methyltransferase
MKVSTSTLGFPRVGPKRELKFALEKYWRSSSTGKTKDNSLLNDLLQVAKQVEEKAWTLQKQANIDRITVGDYFLYDGMLQWANMLGIVPQRYHFLLNQPDQWFSILFAMARGINEAPALSKLHLLQ